MRHFCSECGDEVAIPKGTEKLAQKIKVVCDECVDDMEGTRFGDFFERVPDGTEKDLHGDDDQGAN